MTGRDLTRKTRIMTLVVFNLLAWGMVLAMMLQGGCFYSQAVQPMVVNTLPRAVGVRVLEVRVVPAWIARLIDGFPLDKNGEIREPSDEEYLFVRRVDWEEQTRDIARARNWMIRADQLLDACTIQEVSP